MLLPVCALGGCSEKVIMSPTAPVPKVPFWYGFHSHFEDWLSIIVEVPMTY